MKRSQILLFLLFLLIIPYVVAQDSQCQYGFTESYSENEMVLTYEDSNVINGKVPVFSDFAKGNKSSSFMVFNPNDYDILIVFNYTVEGHGGANRNYGLKVLPYNYSQVRETCYADNTFGECSINQSTLTYFITKPKIMYPKSLNVNKIREVCCPSGQKNCSNSCLTSSAKMAGEAYLCDWECQSGIGIDGICKWTDGHSCTQPTDCLSGKCNIAGVCGDFIRCPNGTQSCNDKLCVKPSNKTIREAYSCIWECQSGSGKDGVCQKSMPSMPDILLFVAIIGLIFAAAQYFYQKSKRVGEELAEIEKKLTKAKKDKEKIDEDLKNVKKRSESEIRELELKKINAKEEAKKEVATQIAKMKEEAKAEIEQLTIQIAKIEQEKAKMIHKKNEFKNEALEMNAAKFEQRKENLEFNNAGYIKFKSYILDGRPSDTLLHVWAAKNQIYNAHKEFFSGQYPNMNLGNGGLEVHHIDYVKYHNEKENLAIISKEEHARIIHEDIPKGDRDKGIQILKEMGIKQPHIPKLKA